MKNHEINFISSVFRHNEVKKQQFGRGIYFHFRCGKKRYSAQFFEPPQYGVPKLTNHWMARIDGVYNDAETIYYFRGLERAVLWVYLAIKRKRTLLRKHNPLLIFLYSDF